MPNAAYEVLFSTNAPKVEREIKRLQRQVSDPIVPTVDLKQLKALNAELDLKQRHLRQTIAYFRQNAIAPKFEMSMGQLSPAEVKKALPSSAMAQAGKEAGKTFAKALKGSVESNVIDADIKLLDPAKIEVLRNKLVSLIGLTRTTKKTLIDMAQIASKKGVEFPGLSQEDINSGLKNITLAPLKKAMATGMKDAGADAILGLTGALVHGGNATREAVTGLGKTAIAALRAVFRSHSPALAWFEIGVDAVKGLVGGIDKYAAKAVKGAKDLGRQILDALQGEVNRGSSMDQLGKKLASLTTNPAYYRRKIKQVGFENLPIEITNAATQRLENPPSRISKLLGIKGDFERQLDAAIAGLRNTAKRAQSTGMIAAGGGGGIAGGGGGRGGGGLSGGGGFGGGFRFDPRDSLRSLQNVINRAEAIAYRAKIDSPQFISMNQLAGRMRGRYERGQNLAERAQLRTSALAFDEGSLTRINKLLQEAQIRASEVAPNSQAWKNAQTDIAKLSIELANASRQARSIELSQLQATLPEKSLDFLNAKLEKARLSASRLSPNLNSWHDFQKVIGQSEAELEKLERQSNRVRLKQKENALAPGSIARLETQLQRAQLNLKYAAPDTTRFKLFRDEVKKTELALEKLNAKMRMKERFGAAAGSVLYGGGLAGSPLSALAGVVGGFMGGIPGSFTGAAIGQSADQAIAAAKATTDYAASISKLRIALAGVSSGLQGYRANLSAVNDISNKFALSPDKVIMPYTRLQASVKAAGYDVSVTKNAFEAILAASIATGGGIDDLDGSLRALTQVFAKGTVQSEELVGQLSERIPGAFAKFAQANKMSTSELKDALAAGRVGLEEMITFLDKLRADYAKSAATIVQSEEYAGQRMTKALDDLRANVGNALIPIGAAFQDWATGIINNTSKVIDFLKKLGVLSGAPTASQLLTQLGEGTLTPDQLRQQIADLEARKGTPGFRASAVNFVAGFGSKQYKDAVQSITEKLFGGKDNEALKGRLGTLKTALMQYLELEKNQQAENAATLYEDQIKKAKSYSEKYYSLIQARDEQLADARESHEKKLQDIRLSQAKELSDYIAKLDEDRRQMDLDTLQKQRSNELLRLDNEDAIALLNARMRGEDTTALQIKQRVAKAARDNEEAIIKKREAFEVSNRKRQEDIDKMRKKNAEEINKANRENAEAVAKIQLKFSRDSKKIFADAAVEFGRNMSQSAAIIGKETAITLVMYHRVLQGLNPRNDGKILDPVIERLQKELDNLRKGVFGSPPSKPATPSKGQGGPDLPESKLPKAGPTPSGAMPVPGRDKLPPDYFLGTDANGTRQINPKHIPRSQQVDAPSSSVPIAVDRTKASQGASITAEQKGQTEEERRKSIEDIEKAQEPVAALNESYRDLMKTEGRRLTLLRDGLNPALVDQVVNQENVYDSAIKLVEAIAGSNEELKQYVVRLRILESGILNTVKATANLTAQVALERDYREKLREAMAPPGIEAVKADLRTRYGTDNESILNREAKRILSLESLTKVSGGIKSLGETMNATLGNAIVNAATDWKNFSGNIQDTLKSLQDAFKQLANTIIQELTRAYANKAVSWLMRTFLGPNPMESANVDPISKAWQTGFGSNAIEDIGQYLLPGSTQSSTFSDWKTGFTSDLGIRMIPRLADGGIAKAPTLGMIGEGRFNEAIIPMPNNRAVPVQLRGDMGSNYATSIAVTVNNSGDGGAQSQMSGDQGNKLAGVLDRAVKDAILSEQRPGGLLYRQ